MKLKHFSTIAMMVMLISLLSENAYTQLVPSTSLPRLDPQLLNYGGSWDHFPPSSWTKCQLAFGWYYNQRYAHWIGTRHDAGTTRRNALDFYLWKPGNSTTALGTNHVMSITGNGLALGNIWEVPTGYIMKAVGNILVDGFIECEKLEIKSISADFVFADDYQLPKLWEVDQFINENKHLPGIPPASETKQGVDLGEFTQTLLQKIEELTLYVIDQQKQIEDLQNKLDSLHQ